VERQIRVSAYGHGDHFSDTSSDVVVATNGGVCAKPQLFLRDPAYLCGSDCLCAFADEEVPSV